MHGGHSQQAADIQRMALAFNLVAKAAAGRTALRSRP
jgi:hypothetical protein